MLIMRGHWGFDGRFGHGDVAAEIYGRLYKVKLLEDLWGMTMSFSRNGVVKKIALGREVLVAALFVLAVPGSAPAVEIQPGQIYSGGTRLEVSGLGVAFRVPEGWRGTLPAGSEIFILQPDADPEIYILAMGEQATRAQLASTMGAPIAIGNGLSLHPTADLVERGEVLAGRYEVRGAASQLAAYSEALAGSNGVAIAFILIAAPALLTTYEANVQALIASTDLGAPNPPPTVASESKPANTDTAAADRWDLYLKGKHIIRYYTTTGYTEEQYLWLCSDGTFSRSGKSGGFGGGASGAYEGSSSGRWTATGAGEYGALILHFGDGSTSRYELRWDYEANKLYVDGKRWLHGKNERCI
ncbi:MAG: hypothetical protein ABFS45_01370 [Pseudomonadota bacterium]